MCQRHYLANQQYKQNNSSIFCVSLLNLVSPFTKNSIKKMEVRPGNTKKSIGIYRCPDDIRYFKIRIKIGEFDSRTGKPPEKYTEKEFYWQQKCFSKSQKQYYKDERNCYTEFERKYHDLICELEENEGDDDSLFTYVDEEQFSLDYEITDRTNYLQNAMDKLVLGDSVKEYEFTLTESVRKSIDSPMIKNAEKYMYLMVDLGEYFEDTWIKNERLLCTIKFDYNSKVLSVNPDFTTSHQPYTLKIQNEVEKTFCYFIEHSSKNIPESIAVNEKTLIKKINDYKTSIKNRVLTDSFKMPQKNKLQVFLFLEISSGKNFEYRNLYVQYFVHLPEQWSSPHPESLSGRTQICRAVKDAGLVHFGYCTEILLEYNFLQLQNTEFPPSPYIYFEVISKASWDRHRTEGLCYKCLPVSRSGNFKYTMNCFRLTSRNPINEMRRFFIGDCQNYNDVTWIGIPNDHENPILNKFGSETITTGELNITLSILHQSQSLLENLDDQKEKSQHQRLIFEKLGSSSLIKSVEQVIREFRKARQQMLEARKNV